MLRTTYAKQTSHMSLIIRGSTTLGQHEQYQLLLHEASQANSFPPCSCEAHGRLEKSRDTQGHKNRASPVNCETIEVQHGIHVRLASCNC
jgi:hypothetical protein